MVGPKCRKPITKVWHHGRLSSTSNDPRHKCDWVLKWTYLKALYSRGRWTLAQNIANHEPKILHYCGPKDHRSTTTPISTETSLIKIQDYLLRSLSSRKPLLLAWLLELEFIININKFSLFLVCHLYLINDIKHRDLYQKSKASHL